MSGGERKKGKAPHERKESDMAEKKMTRKEALETAIAITKEYLNSDMWDFSAEQVKETIEVLEKMYAQVTKPRPRKANTAKRDANIALGEKFAEVWDEETFKAANVAEILEVSKPKANAICKAMGWEEIPTTEKVKVYKL